MSDIKYMFFLYSMYARIYIGIQCYNKIQTVKLFLFYKDFVFKQKQRQAPYILLNYKKSLQKNCILHLDMYGHFLGPFLLLCLLLSAAASELMPKCSLEHGCGKVWKSTLLTLDQETVAIWSIIPGKAQSF